MAWRQQKQSSANSNSDRSENRFDKFFKKNNSTGSRFNNKRYERRFGNEKPSSESEGGEKTSYHEGFDPDRDNEMRSQRFQNRNQRFRSDRRSNYNNNYRNDRRSNQCRSFQKYGNCKFGDSCRFSHETTSKKSTPPRQKTFADKISSIQEQLSSGKYISKSKKEELEKEIEDLKVQQKNEFPSLESTGIQGPMLAPAPPMKSTCWGKIASSKVLSKEGVEDANKRAKAKRISELAKKKQEQRKVYDQHVESDYEGDDFFDDDDSLMDDDYYDDDEYYDDHDL